MKQMTCIGIRPKVVLSLFLNEHNALYQAKFENDVIKLCLSGANADKSLPVQKRISNIEVTANKHVETVVNYRHGRLNARSSFGTDKNEANVENSGTVEMPDLNDLINNLQRLYAVNILDDEAQIKEVQEGTLTCQNGKIRNIVSCSKQDDSFEEHNQTTKKQCQPLKDVGRKGNDNDKGNLKHIFQDIGSVFISAPRVCIVAPVTRNEHRGDEQKAVVLRKLYDIVERTLKHESVPAQESMMFELLRLCTFRTFPKDKKPDVNAFSAAGFYYASKNDEVICYSCYKRISNWGNSDDPSIVHRRISPECKFNTNNSEVNVSKAVTTLVESDIMAKLQGTRGLRNASHANNATFSAPKVPSNVIDGKSPSATGSSHESSVAIQMKTFQKTNHDHDAPSDSSPPTSRLSDTTAERRFQSMILQTTSTDIVSSIRSRFQTGKFVSSVNFAIPDSNTKAIQPVDNNIIPGITIDDYIQEYNSGCNDDNKSISKPSTQARDKGLNGIVESLITSEASSSKAWDTIHRC
ncbi:uncharacterized protein LOC127834471 [Dreissena polymorpha]|uniref:uncharacterized protein LOC127834471 n=1 Tax=Dreissena polymorpha TaxID=45954 RepID=UPI0022647C57|nr:uncharacterized protein LOC127834471 [Dreissena polymorpha]XP_052216295.1 uncharacterized protein LOC127834471 [Dreissena polymorpha]